MKFTRFLLISSMMLAFLSFGGGVFAEDDLSAGLTYGPRAGRGDSRRMDEVHKQIGLSDEQKTKVEKLNKDHSEKASKLRKELKTAMDNLRTELEKTEKTDKSKIKKLSKKVKDAQAKMVDIRTNHILDLKDILKPEQFEQLNKLQKDRGRRMRPEAGKKPGRSERFMKKDGSGPHDMKAGKKPGNKPVK